MTAARDGITIAVRVTPRSSRDSLGPGQAPDLLAARIAAPPVDGAANDALVRLVAKAFDVPRRAVTLTSGDTARIKRLHVAGDPQALDAIARRLYGVAP